MKTQAEIEREIEKYIRTIEYAKGLVNADNIPLVREIELQEGIVLALGMVNTLEWVLGKQDLNR